MTLPVFLTTHQLSRFSAVDFERVRRAVERNVLVPDAMLLGTAKFPSRPIFHKSRLPQLAKLLANFQ